jgi:hypothetical protein
MKKYKYKFLAFFLFLLLSQSGCFASDDIFVPALVPFRGDDINFLGTKNESFLVQLNRPYFKSSYIIEKRLERGTGTAVGAGLGGFVMAIATLCTDSFKLYSGNHCRSILNVPAILFGAVVGGAAGFMLAINSEKAMVAYRVSF